MIDVAIKYLIADVCIDVFFKRLMCNFKLDIDNSAPQVGSFYSRIKHNYSDETYYGCQVIEIEPINELPGHNIVYIKFESCDGRGDSEYELQEVEDIEDFSESIEEMSDDDMREYVREISEDVVSELSREELTQLMFDDGVDMSDVDLVETAVEDEVGVSTAFFTFYK